MSEWKNFVSSYAIENILSDVNELVGEGRHIAPENLESVAASAYEYYSTYMDNSEIPNAILWDMQEYANYASGLGDRNEFTERYTSLLPSGHPDSESLDPVAAAAWISGSPELSPAAGAVIVASLTPTEDLLKLVHATTRLKALMASGEVADNTKELIYSRIAQITEISPELL
jgi:hypothetical protein